MERNIMWTPWSEPGLEHLRLTQQDGGMLADSLIVGISNRMPFRLYYEITCDSSWNVKELDLMLLSGSRKSLKIQADGHGHWFTSTGGPIPSIDGCIDVDISATPFTNTLPIRRLKLNPGQSAELLVAYVLIPEVELMTDRQRYTCLELHTQGGLYKYESMESDFKAELPVDSDGLVIDYPGLFKSIWRSEVTT
ncbi:MAG: putative glycolipid-binding domain-containing protein [Ktedonobacteraceae bacterium]